MDYSTICLHQRLQRIDKNFIRCLACGQSFVNQINIPKNKTGTDFSRENKIFDRNFERNFNNVIEEKDLMPVLIEYYADKRFLNIIVIDKTNLFSNNPPKYRVFINGNYDVLTENQIKCLLNDTKATRVDKKQIEQQLLNQYP